MYGTYMEPINWAFPELLQLSKIESWDKFISIVLSNCHSNDLDIFRSLPKCGVANVQHFNKAILIIYILWMFVWRVAIDDRLVRIDIIILFIVLNVNP